ncbi:tautomerase family protein [Janibacter sp. GS2]|uniref:tautomerase family protein n=1 Tax=Janibacter sp. GS2 TaxID=3442646 RepID=UPI003EB7FC3A
MPVVQVTLTEGRTPETIRSMISGVTQALVDSGVAPREAVRVLVTEIPTDHFAAGDVTITERHAAQAATTTPEEGQS